MNFLRTKNGKIFLAILSVVLIVAIVLCGVLTNVQFAKKNIALSTNVRNVLLKNFDKTELGNMADVKRVINNENPLNLINYYGDDEITKLWSVIPESQKPYSVLLLIPGQILLGNSDKNLQNLENWADICEQNSIPYIIQAINGETHMEARPPIKYLEERFAKHEYFYGLNAAELYNGVSWRGKAESDNSLYIMNMIKLCAKYGAYFVWTDTNLNYKSGMLLEWLENNEAFYTTFKNYSDYICLLNKESIASPETYAVMQGLWLAGLVGNWGVASDWWHWQIDGYKSLFGEANKYVDNEWEQIFCYPENMYVQSMMLVISRGGTCFKQEAPGYSIGYNGNAFAGFEYAISPFLDRIISKKFTIPTKAEVFAATSFAVLGMDNYSTANYDFKESNLYPQSGNSGIVPLLPENLRKAEREMFAERGITLLDYKTSTADFLRAFGTNDANTYLTNTGENWYFINNSENKKGTKYAKFTPNYSSAESFYIESEEHSSAIIKDTRNGFRVYLSNYRTDKTEMLKMGTPEVISQLGWANYLSRFLSLDGSGNPIGVTDTALRKTVIEIKGTLDGGEPLVRFVNHSNGMGANNRKYNIKSTFNAQTQTLRLEIEHNGMVEFEVQLDDSGKDYKILAKQGVEFEYKQIEADTTALQELIKEKVEDSHNYTYFSYLEYERQYEKAKIMIEEKVYSQKEIDNQVEALTNAKAMLINISKEVQALQQVQNGSYQAATMTAFDSLLRELLSCQKYVEGRSNILRYKSIYKNKSSVNAIKAKPKYIQKAYKNLLLYM